MVADVATGLGTRRLVTLTGPPGCGKTRLAAEVAQKVGGDVAFAWLVNLAPGSPADAVADAVGLALGAPEAPDLSPADAVAAAASGRDVLVVLDNCEHLVDATPEVVLALLRGGPGVRILATSREDIGLYGEVIWRVPPLTPPDRAVADPLDRLRDCESGRLVLDRLELAQPDRPVGAGDAELLSAICSALDGMPFAIEIAVGQLGRLGLAELAEQVSAGRLGLLRRSTRRASPGWESSEESVAWSYDLLDDGEQVLLRRLTAFAGAFGAAAAHAVAGDEGDDPEVTSLLLDRLVHKSLVQAEEHAGGLRFRLLAVVHQACARRIDLVERAVTADRHLRYYAQLADRLGTVDGPVEIDDVLTRSVTAVEDLRRAIAWASETGSPLDGLRIVAGLRWLWIDIGRLPEARQRLSDLLGACATADASALAQGHLAAATLAIFAADPLGVVQHALPGRALARQVGDEGLEGEAQVLQGWAQVFLAPRDAPSSLTAGRAQLRRAGDRLSLVAWATVGHGIALGNLGRLTDGVAELRSGVDAVLPSRHWMCPFALAALGYLETLLGDFASAEQHLLLALGDTTPDTFRFQAGQWHALLLSYQGRDDEASAAFAIAHAGAAGPGGSFVPGWLHYGIHAFGRGDLDHAAALVVQAQERFRLMGWQWFEAQGERLLGDIAAARRDLHTAGIHRRKAAAVARDSGNPLAEAVASTGMALQHLAECDRSRARRRLGTAVRRALGIGYVLGAVDALTAFVLVAADAAPTGDEAVAALQVLGAVTAHRQRIGYTVAPVHRPALDEAKAILLEAAREAGEAATRDGSALTLAEAAVLAFPAARRPPRPVAGLAALTSTQRMVGEHVAEGLTNEEIAAEMGITVSTVKNHLQGISVRLGLKGRGRIAKAIADGDPRSST